MSKVNLTAKDWCDLVFEGRNKDYGAYRLRAKSGSRQLKSVLIVILVLVAILVGAFVRAEVKKAMKADLGDNEQVTALSQLKKEDPKKEEKKIEKPKEEPKPDVQKVAVKASISFTVPKIVDDNLADKSKELKTQKEVGKSNFAIASQDYAGDSKNGINIDDLKDNQRTGGTTIPPKQEEVVDNALVEVQASFPGGEAALINYVNSHVKYPEIALEQELQGTVVLRFKVDKDGSVSDVMVKKSLSRECDQAAIKTVRSLPRFIPAKSQGHPVPVWYTLPVRFKIN